MEIFLQGRLGSVLLFGLMLALIIPLNRIAKKRSQTPFWWETILITVWTVLLMLGRFIRTIISGTNNESIYLIFLIVTGVVLFLGTYSFIFITVYRKKDHLDLDHEIDNIGKNNEDQTS